MAHHVTHADDAELRLLVFGDEDSAAFRSAADHVQHCPQCQSRLSQMAGTSEFDKQASSMLSELGSSDVLEPLFSRESSRPEERLEFLSPPSHPEMLGRLGRYEIERVIGSGGMGIVLKAFDSELNRPVAIKVLARHLAHSGAARQRFARESRAAAAVVHEHVVAIYNVETDGAVPFLVMQYVPGESLQARVEREGPLDVKETLRIGIQAAAGLAAAHEQGVIHRDIKPANILLEQGVERILLTDFGLARTVDDASLTHTGIVAGTPHYMSPEQANGETADHRTDLFSLGSVLYFMATGRPPFRAERPMGVLHRICHDPHRPAWHVNGDIPWELSKIIDRMLDKKPSRRFDDATEVKDALARLLAKTQRGGLRPEGPLSRLIRRWPRLVASTGLAIVLIVAAAAAWISRSNDHRPTTAPNASRETAATAQTAASSAGTQPAPAPQPADVLAAESAAYSAAAQELVDRLDGLESSLRGAQFVAPRDHFWSDAHSFQTRLQELETDTFRGSVTPSLTGEGK